VVLMSGGFNAADRIGEFLGIRREPVGVITN